MSDQGMRVEFEVPVGDDKPRFAYPKLYALSEFLEKYGEDNCTIMMQDRERFLYETKAVELLNTITGAERYQNVQLGLDAWKPCDERPPTELEKMALAMLNLPPQAQAVVRAHIDAGIAAKRREEAAQQTEVAAQIVEDIADKYTTDKVGEPVTTFQTEPEFNSFEEQGRMNDEAVQTAQAGQEQAIKENAEDYAAPTDYAQDVTEGATTEQ